MKRISAVAALSVVILVSGAEAASAAQSDSLDVLGSVPVASTPTPYLVPGLSSLPFTEFLTPAGN